MKCRTGFRFLWWIEWWFCSATSRKKR